MDTTQNTLFLTSEYKTLVKVHERLKEQNTLRNVTIFEAYRMKCISLAVRKYDDVGFNGNGYAWLKRLDRREWSFKKYMPSDFTRLWSKHWPVDGDLNIDGLLKEVQAI
ncbi:MAG: hypothetical protein O2963_00060 [Proteobacteria bacterium]|nr:hypothetical protein [Pseudomonadota bacterium]